jgi:hypothetical protein
LLDVYISYTSVHCMAHYWPPHIQQKHSNVAYFSVITPASNKYIYILYVLMQHNVVQNRKEFYTIFLKSDINTMTRHDSIGFA